MKQKMVLNSLIVATGLLFMQSSMAASCGEIVLGASLSLTGKHSTNGIHVKNGYQYAASVINKSGGIQVGGKCYHIKVTYYDDESKADSAAAMTKKLITQDKVQYMLGPFSSGITKAVAPVTEEYQIPMVEATGASRSLFNNGYQYLFAVLSTSEQYMASAVTLAAETAEAKGISASSVKLAIVVGDNAFARDIRAGVLADAKRYGMNVVLSELLSPASLENMGPILEKVALLEPDLLIVSGYSAGALTAIQQIDKKGIKIPMVALTHCEAANIVKKLRKAANNMLCSTQWSETLSYKDKLFGTALEYEKRFKKANRVYGRKKVPYQAAGASAAVYVFKDAFERADSLDKDKVRDALASTDLETFYGRIKFSEKGNNIAKPMVLRQIQEGKYHVVAPASFASHTLILPR